MKGVFVSLLVMVGMVHFMVKPGDAISCADVSAHLAACLPYLTGKAGAVPPAACCAGVSKLKDSAATVADKQAACGCVKAAASRIPDIKDAAASSLPTKCKVQTDIPISRSFNCADIH